MQQRSNGVNTEIEISPPPCGRRRSRWHMIAVAVTGFLMVGLTTSGAMAQGAPTPSTFSPQEQQAYVEAHNVQRREVGAPPVTWDHQLAAHAQAHANYLAQTGKNEHMSRDERRRLDQGENIARSSGRTREGTIARSTQRWVEEKFNNGQHVYVPGITYREIKSRNPGHVLGHYIQMIWGNSRRIGAGVAQIQTGSRKGGYVVVARYGPRGNRNSEIPVPNRAAQTTNNTNNTGGQVYFIRNVATNRLLTANGTSVSLGTNSSRNAQWTLVQSGNVYALFNPATNKYLGRATERNPIPAMLDANGPYTKWELRKKGNAYVLFYKALINELGYVDNQLTFTYPGEPDAKNTWQLVRAQ